jgi:hypothetical protein
MFLDVLETRFVFQNYRTASPCLVLCISRTRLPFIVGRSVREDAGIIDAADGAAAVGPLTAIRITRRHTRLVRIEPRFAAVCLKTREVLQDDLPAEIGRSERRQSPCLPDRVFMANDGKLHPQHREV